MKDNIIEVIKDCQGCKATELPVKLVHFIGAWDVELDNLPELIEELVSEGKLCEIEYILPGTDRIKSFLLPAGTEISQLIDKLLANGNMNK